MYCFFSNNSWIYNEEEILQEIHGKVSSSVRFSIRLPPTAEYENKRSSYLTSFPNFKINTLDINFWLEYDLSKNYLFDYAYPTDLTANSLFIFTGPSTAMLDVMEMNSHVAMVCLENMHTDKSLWDYRVICDREVLREICNYDRFHRFNSVKDLLRFINDFDEYIENETNSESNYSSQLYNQIEET